MKITNIFGGHPDPVPQGKRGDAADLAAAAGAKTTNTASASAPSSDALRQILAKYDVADITPSEFSQMIQKLHESGVISQQEFQDLSAIRVDLDASGVSQDESVDLLDLYRDKVQKVQRASDTDPTVSQQIPALLRRLDWMEKFSAMHAQPELVGMSALA